MAHQEDVAELLDWACAAELYAVGYLRILADAIERGDAELQVDPSAWENTLAAVEWAMMDHARGRVRGPTSITDEDVDQMRRLHRLGSAALSGGERSPELYALALQCMQSLCGPNWRRAAQQAASCVRALQQGCPPVS